MAGILRSLTMWGAIRGCFLGVVDFAFEMRGFLGWCVDETPCPNI